MLFYKIFLKKYRSEPTDRPIGRPTDRPIRKKSGGCGGLCPPSKKYISNMCLNIFFIKILYFISIFILSIVKIPYFICIFIKDTLKIPYFIHIFIKNTLIDIFIKNTLTIPYFKGPGAQNPLF